ncbi:putative transposase [Mycobacterium xenopi 4042]|uniref:Putative transposase n=1 Tax=Mycobacterium xenopi 4042 TaxID=1299334 RepID=X8DNA7_MYCXE|nr:putative transposase [Mycobacterium xenopi 4042]
MRRVKDARHLDALFPVWRYHPFVTNSALPVDQADITHRRHAIIETTFADLIDGPLAHIPSGLFAANCAWLACAVIAHNLLRAVGTLAGGHHAVARGATLRRDLINIPARFAAPAANQCCTYPPTGIGEPDGRPCGTTSSVTRSRNPAPPDPTFQALSAPPSQARPKEPKGKLVQASGSPTPHRATLGRIPKQPRRRQHEITHPRIQAKTAEAKNGPPNRCVPISSSAMHKST